MFFNNKLKTIVLIVSTLVLNQGCFDEPDEFVAPTWNTKINLKITSKEFSLLEMVEKDSSLLKSSNDPETLGLIYFGDTQPISTITIEDNLRINSFETNFSQTIGPLNISTPEPIESVVRIEDWAEGVTSGSSLIFPEQEGNIKVEIGGIESFESIIVDNGVLIIQIFNNLPIPIQLRGMTIRNFDNQSVIAELPSNDQNQWISVASRKTETVNFPLAPGTEISNSLEYEGILFSVGSNGQVVEIQESDGTVISASFKDLVIGAAIAALPVQQFQFSEAIILDDSTKIETATIKEGRAIITVNNNMDVNLTATLNFENLFDENSEQYKLIIKVNKNEKNKIIEIPSLSNWSIVTTTPGIPTNKILYSVEVLTDSTGEVSTISKNDSISFVLNFDELFFESFTGLLKPDIFTLEESGFKLDYGDIKEQLQFAEINFKDAVFNLNLRSSAEIELLIDGELFATNGVKTESLNITNIFLPSTEPAHINISNLLNNFSSELPDSFSMIGTALLNPNYQIGTVSMGDSIHGSIDFEIPLNVGIAQGTFADTLELDLGDVDKDDINRLNYGEVTFTITNEIPVGITFSAKILDSNYTQVLKLPTENDNMEVLEIPMPTVSETGDIILAGQKEQTLMLFGDDIKQFLNNPYLLLEINFNTAGKDTTPVKFKTSNKISFDVKAKAEYKVEL